MRQIEDLHEKSEESGLEYGGWIVKDPSGGYSIPEVKVGTEKEVALGELPPNTIGSVHVHPHILSASPSPRDQASAQANPNVDINITLSGFGDAAYLDNKGEQFRCEGPYNWFAQEEK